MQVYILFWHGWVEPGYDYVEAVFSSLDGAKRAAREKWGENIRFDEVDYSLTKIYEGKDYVGEITVEPVNQ